MAKLIPIRWKWEWITGLLALAINGVILFIVNVNFTIERFTDRAIGSAIVDGVDPKLREPVYYIALFLILFIIYALWWLFSKVQVSDEFSTLWFEIGLFELFSLILHFKNLFVGSDWSEVRIEDISIGSFSLLLLVFLFILEIVSKLLKKTLIIKEYITLIFSSLSLTVLILILMSETNIYVFSNRFLLISLFVLFLVSSLYLIGFKQNEQKLNAFVFLLPFLMLPKLMQEFYIEPNKFTFILLVLFVGSLFIKRNKILGYLIYPMIFISFFILNYAGPVIELGFLDYLHLGNRVTPVQQFVDFFSIPLVDYWGAQHFSIGSVLYGYLYGVENLEHLAWIDLDILFYLLIFYSIFKHVLKDHFALLVTLFLPLAGHVFSNEYGLLNIYYFGALLPLVVLPYHLKKQSLFSSFLMTTLSLITFVWMPSMGKISIIATVIILAFTVKSKKKALNSFLGWLLSVGITVAIYGYLLYLHGHDFKDQLILIQSFASVDFDIASKAELVGYGASYYQIFLLYGVAPIVYLGSMVYFIFRKNKSLVDYIFLFITIASIISSVRGLARHSLTESRYHFDFLVLLILFLPFALQKSKDLINKSLVLIMSVFFLIFTSIQGDVIAESIESSISINKLSDERVIINEEAYPDKLISILNDVLVDDQTFFENVNAHLLYALTNKKAPFLHHASQMIYNQSSQLVYIKQMNELYENKQLPIVIMSATWWGAYIDQIPTEFSTYQLSEYIYMHYEPWITIDGFELWTAKNSDIQVTYDLSKYGYVNGVDIRQNYGIGMIPYLWATYDEEFISTNYQVFFENVEERPINTSYDIPRIFHKENGNYLVITVDSNELSNTTAILTFDENSFGFTLVPGVHEYAFRMSSQYIWNIKDIDVINILSDSNAKILSFKITSGD